MREPSARSACTLIAKRSNFTRDIGVVGDNGSALARSDLLIWIERQSCDIAERANFLATVLRSDRLTGVFNKRDSMSLRYFQYAINLSRNSERVNDDDRLRTVGDGCFYAFRIKVKSRSVNIDEDRDRAFITNSVRYGNKCERGNNDLVSIGDTQSTNAQMECAGARADAYGVRGTEISSDRAFKFRKLRTQTELRSPKNGRNCFYVLLVDVR